MSTQPYRAARNDGSSNRANSNDFVLNLDDRRQFPELRRDRLASDTAEARVPDNSNGDIIVTCDYRPEPGPSELSAAAPPFVPFVFSSDQQLQSDGAAGDCNQSPAADGRLSDTVSM